MGVKNVTNGRTDGQGVSRSRISVFGNLHLLGECYTDLIGTTELHLFKATSLYIFVGHGLMAIWPFWPYLAIGPRATDMGHMS